MASSLSGSGSGLIAWRVVQVAVLAAGIAAVVTLVARPKIGLVAIWDVLIPAAPALLVFAPGLWRNICPLGTVSQLARHLGLGLRLRASPGLQGGLAAGSTALLLLLVPSRHVGLDDSGVVSAAALVALGTLALVAGFLFDGKSGWCSGLCPVHPVELLYGARPAVSFTNAHCVECVRCVPVCPDSTPAMSPLTPGLTKLQHALGLVLLGGFPGFVWGWYRVPAGGSAHTLGSWVEAYGWTWGAMSGSLAIFLVLRALAGPSARAGLERLFVGAAVSTYYWYKLPALLGLGGSGTVLIDLGAVLPPWSIWACRALTTVVLLGWIAAGPDRAPGRAWLHRPRFAPGRANGAVPVTIGGSEPA
jgi:polyferredoxin